MKEQPLTMLDALKLTEMNLRSLIAAKHADEILMTPWLETVQRAIKNGK